jgi:arylsulfatase A-like enzyme
MLDRRQFFSTGLAALAPAARRPNVLLILSDDQGSADCGFMGCRDIPTPNIDRIARQGVRFTQAYVSHPFCSPTRAGILTGRYQQRFGHELNPIYDPADTVSGLPLNEVTLAQALAAAGYRTGHVGKWHLGASEAQRPWKRGFHESFGFLGGGHDYFKSEPTLATREYNIMLTRNGEPAPLNGYLTDALSDGAADFIRRHRDAPWFLYTAYNAPHTPQQAPPEYIERFAGIADPRRRNYAAMVAAMDDGIGRILKTLDETGAADNTLVIFLSDNGGPVPVNGSSNGKLRGVKGQVYEGGIRTPLAMRFPGRIRPGSDFEQPVISLDFFATACALAGAPPPRDRVMDSVDLLPFLAGKQRGAPHERLYWRTGGGAAHAVREGPYKLVSAGGKDELYDLAADAEEARDVAAAQPDAVKRLAAARDQWNAQLMPPRFEGLPGAEKKAKKK